MDAKIGVSILLKYYRDTNPEMFDHIKNGSVITKSIKISANGSKVTVEKDFRPEHPESYEIRESIEPYRVFTPMPPEAIERWKKGLAKSDGRDPERDKLMQDTIQYSAEAYARGCDILVCFHEVH